MDMYPLDAQEDLRYDSARLLFLVLPDEVVAIDLSESQQVSKESSLPDGQKQRWTIKQVDKYRGKLLSELGQKWEPII